MRVTLSSGRSPLVVTARGPNDKAVASFRSKFAASGCDCHCFRRGRWLRSLEQSRSGLAYPANAGAGEANCAFSAAMRQSTRPRSDLEGLDTFAFRPRRPTSWKPRGEPEAKRRERAHSPAGPTLRPSLTWPASSHAEARERSAKERQSPRRAATCRGLSPRRSPWHRSRRQRRLRVA